MWCPQCGAEYREGLATCTDCGVALSTEPPANPDGANGEDEGTEVVVYELADWTSDQRGQLELRLQTGGIEHSWEVGDGHEVVTHYETPNAWEQATDLVVGERDEEVVDALLDEIENPHALEAVEGDDEALDDEGDYDIMSHLYVAADRLKDNPADLALAGEFFDAADAASGLALPFGVDPDVWARAKQLAAAITTALEEEADDATVVNHAQELRDLLFAVV